MGDLRRELLEGFRETLSNRNLLVFACETATYNVFWTGMEALLWAVRELGHSASAVGLLISRGAPWSGERITLEGCSVAEAAAREWGACLFYLVPSEEGVVPPDVP